jgi:hypothetical protein
MLFNNYIILKTQFEGNSSEFYEMTVEAGGDYSAAWCETYHTNKSLLKFFIALTAYAEKYDNPLHYDFDEFIIFDFSPFSGTGQIDVNVHMNGKTEYRGFCDGYTEITVQTDITEMDNFIRRIGQMINGNTDIAHIDSKRGRFI